MMGSDMKQAMRNETTRPRSARRRWLGAVLGWTAHCSLGASAWAATATNPSSADGRKPLRRVMVVGDSLSAEYGLPRGSGWVALLQKRLAERQPGWEVINASVSGDTTAGGRSRLPGLLAQHRPDVVVLELGGNDALRGLALDATRANLLAMAQAVRQAQARVLLVGMQVPPNYGPRYTREFAQLYEQLARQEKLAWVPFFLKGIADQADPTALFQPDRIHPNTQAQPQMLDNVWAALLPLLR